MSVPYFFNGLYPECYGTISNSNSVRITFEQAAKVNGNYISQSVFYVVCKLFLPLRLRKINGVRCQIVRKLATAVTPDVQQSLGRFEINDSRISNLWTVPSEIDDVW